MDVYVSRSSLSDPTQFTNDIVFKQTTFVRLNTEDMQFLGEDSGFSVTTYAKSYDEGANTYLHNTLKVEYTEVPEVMSVVEDVVADIVDVAAIVRNTDRPIKDLINHFFN